MIIDFQHHFTPREFVKDPGELKTYYDENGAPSYTFHSMLYDLDEHIAMMDTAGIDAAYLSSGAGTGANNEISKKVNDYTRQAEKDYPGRFFGCAHVNPLGGKEAFKEFERCVHELGFQGVIIPSEMDGLFLDAPEFEPFWQEAVRLKQFVFVHPALKLTYSKEYDGYDMARSVGREFSLVMAIIRLIGSGVFDRYPELLIHMSHMGGGIGALLGRIRSYENKEYWGTTGNPRHGIKAKKPLDYYIQNHFVYDTAGICGSMTALKSTMVEIPASRIVFATDYPQEVRGREAVRDFVNNIRALGADGEKILSGNRSLLFKGR